MATNRSQYPSRRPDIAWLNGSFVPWEECVVHGRSQAGFFGANIFEGVRVYWRRDDERMFVFRLDDHMRRLEQSMKIMRMQPAFTCDQLKGAMLALLQRCEFKEHAQVNLVAYFGFPPPGDPLFPTTDTGAHITAVPLGRSPGAAKGITTAISSWRRISDDVMPPRAKVGANYQNSRFAQNEVRQAGFDMAIILNTRGKVAEGPGACLFMIRDGTLITPPITADILESITRDTIMKLAERSGLRTVERDIDRTELLIADEVFLCGSIAEVLPVIAVDGVAVGAGEVGAVTKRLQQLYFDAVEGRIPELSAWCTPVVDNVLASAA